jgi:hypothetical protein
VKILFVCPYLLTVTKRRPLNFVVHLARRHELHLRMLAPLLETRRVLGSARPVEQLCAVCASIESLPVSLPRLCAGGAWRYARGEALRTAYTHAHDGFVSQLNRESDALGIDVVHVDRLRLARLAAGMRRPVVLDLPDCMSWAAEQRAALARGVLGLFYNLEARRLRSFEGGMLNTVPAALVASDEDGRGVRAAGYRGMMTHVPGIIDLDVEDGEAGVALPHPALVFHGTLSFPPNVDAITTFAHQILPLLRTKFHGLQLYIVGAAPGRAVRALGKLEGVHVSADVESIGAWLRAATAVIAPMRIGGGHSQKVCEGLLVGRPVLCSARAAECVAPEVRPSLLVAHGAQDWVQQVERILDDPAGVTALAERGAQTVARLHAAEAVLPVLFDAYRRSGAFPAAA